MKRIIDRILSLLLIAIVSSAFLVLLFYAVNASGMSIYALNLDALNSAPYSYLITLLGASLFMLAVLFVYRRMSLGLLLILPGALQIASIILGNPFAYAFYASLPLVYMIIGTKLKGGYRETVYFFSSLMLLVAVFGVFVREYLIIGWVGFFQLLFIAFEVLLFSLAVFQLLFMRPGAFRR